MKYVYLTIILFVIFACNTIPYHNSYVFDVFSLKEKIMIPKNLSVTIYFEWGLARVIGENLYIMNGLNSENVKKTVEKETLCGNVEELISLGGKIEALNSSKESLKIECLYQMKNTDKLTSRGIQYFLSNVLGTWTTFGIFDNSYKVIYFGDSIKVKDGAKYNHHRLTQKFIEIREKEKNPPIIWKKEMYELSFDYSNPILSFSFTNDVDLKKYYELKMNLDGKSFQSLKYKKLFDDALSRLS